MISVVVPVYNEEATLAELYRRTATQLEQVGEEWELIFVDDGSSDGSGPALRALREKDKRVKVVELSRNFGHQQALTAGIESATGACVVLMDGDLQDPPEVIPALVQKWRDGYQVVFAERRSRKDRGLRSIGFLVFYPVFRLLSDLPATQQAGVFGLMDRVVIDEFIQLRESNRFIPALRSWLGFRQAGVAYDREERGAGQPKQSLGSLVKYAMDGVISFSYKPLRAATLMGFVTSAAALVLAVFYFVTFFTMNKPITGFTTIIVCVLFIGGVQLICVGILGEYIGRIYEEVKRRPLFVVRSRTGFD
jgi:glycosyltransferase involved in cell wall biosynthesis